MTAIGDIDVSEQVKLQKTNINGGNPLVICGAKVEKDLEKKEFVYSLPAPPTAGTFTDTLQLRHYDFRQIERVWSVQGFLLNTDDVGFNLSDMRDTLETYFTAGGPADLIYDGSTYPVALSRLKWSDEAEDKNRISVQIRARQIDDIPGQGGTTSG